MVEQNLDDNGRLEWNRHGENLFQVGVDRGVLYVEDAPGVPWNGLTSVAHAPVAGEASSFYIDGYKYHNEVVPEEYSATITAFTYPDEFSECDGTSSHGNGLYIDEQPRKKFGFAYRTRVGNDIQGVKYGYRLHMVYNALASPSQFDYATIADTTAPTPLSWTVTTQPIFVDGMRPASHFVVDSTKSDSSTMQTLENILYGTAWSKPRLPKPHELFELFKSDVTLSVFLHGDGTWTASGPDDVVKMITEDQFEITWPSVVYIEEDMYEISSS